jgi:excisionase family DNA binding protein
VSKIAELVEDGLVAVIDASKFLAVSRATIYELMSRGELAYVKVGRCRRIPRRALFAFAAHNLKGGWKS